MQNWLLVNIPEVVLGVGIVALAVAIAVLGLLLVRRSVEISTLEAHHDVAGFILAVIGVVYAVLLAFVVITVWQNYDKSKTNANQEAVTIESVYRDGLALQRLAPDLPPAIRAYAVSVADAEWPAMATHHTDSPETNQALNRVWHDLNAIRPATNGQSDFYSDAIAELHQAAQFRQIRILSSGDELPSVLWVVLIVGAFITIGFTYFFGVSSFASQVVMVSALAVSVSLVLFLILSLDLPFTGGTAVGPDAIHYAIHTFAAEAGSAH